MKNEKQERLLKSVGKRCFVNCFELAKRQSGNLSDQDIIDCDPTVGRKGLGVRRACIAEIFGLGLEYESLRECTGGSRLSANITRKAKDLYDRHFGR